MRCWQCRQKGIESTMIRKNGVAHCPRCGREVRYLTNSERRTLSRSNNNPGCATKIICIAFGLVLIVGIVHSFPWILLLLLVPLLWWAVHQPDEDNDNDHIHRSDEYHVHRFNDDRLRCFDDNDWS